MNHIPSECIAVQLRQHLPPQPEQWNEDLLKRHLSVDKLRVKSPKQGQVLVKMERAPINPVDLLIMTKQYAKEICEQPLPILLGQEGCGTVVAQGGGFEGLVGKRVAIFGKGWAEYCIVGGKECIVLPDEVSWDEGCSAFINPGTAVGMIKIARDRGINSIIFTAAASALGKMVIKHGKANGVNVICVVRKDQQVKECKEAGASDVLNSSDRDFDEQLKRIAQQQKAVLAYDAVGGQLTGRILNAMPYGSEIKIYGNLSMEKAGGLVFSDIAFEKKTVSGYWLADQLKDDPSFSQIVFQQVPQMLKGELGTKIANTFSLEDIHKAIAHYVTNMTRGKCLINLSSSRRS